MTAKDQRRVLFIAAAILAAGAAGVVASAALLPLDVGGLASPSGKKALAATQPARKAESLGAYAVIYQRDLRKPLFDPEAAKVEAPKPPPLTVTLKGTVVEDGFSYAILRNKGGEEKLLKVGDSLEGAEVVSIEQGEATVHFYGQTITLKAQLKEGT
jgi:type II secretory pathway component PulC